MAGKRDMSVVAVINGLTKNQAAKITGDIMKAKNRTAPLSRGTVVSASSANVGKILQKNTKRIGG